MNNVKYEQLHATVARSIGIDPILLKPETRLYDLPGFDSMAILLLIVELDELGVNIPQDKAAKIRTFSDILDLANLK